MQVSWTKCNFFCVLNNRKIRLTWVVGRLCSVAWGRRTRRSCWPQRSRAHTLTGEPDRGGAGGRAGGGGAGRQHGVLGKRASEEGTSPSLFCTMNETYGKMCFSDKSQTACTHRTELRCTSITLSVCIPLCRGTLLRACGLSRSICRGALL